MEDGGQRTLLIGVGIAFAIYALSVAVIWLVPGDRGYYVSIGLTLLSMVVILVWFLAVRRGWRLTKGPSRGQRRAKAHRDDDKERIRRQRMSRR